MSVSARFSGESREPASEAAFPRGLLFVLAACAGTSVANLYYAQPLLALIAGTFDVSAHIGWVAAARNRINTLYVTSIFLGGSLGASLASLGWAHAGYGQPYVHWG